MENNYTNAYLVFASDLGFFESTARNYKKDALLVKGGDFGSCTPSFHLLSSLAFELFPKVLIGYNTCIKHKDNDLITEKEIRDEIARETTKFNHNLANLYKAFPELMEYLNVLDVNEFKNDYVWDYRMKLNNNKEISLKNSEASRYGSFAKSRNIVTWCVDDDAIIELLEKLEKFVEIKNKETNEILRKSLDSREGSK